MCHCYTKLSPAQCVFGRPIRDLIPILPGRYRPHDTWWQTLQAREEALRNRLMKAAERWAEHTQRLPPLTVGDRVRVQNQTGLHPRKWDKTGRVIEVRQYDQYVIRIDGSGRATLRNRKFLRKYIAVYPNPAPVDDFQRPYGHGPAFQLHVHSPPGNGLPTVRTRTPAPPQALDGNALTPDTPPPQALLASVRPRTPAPTHAGTWQECPDPRHPSSTSPTPHCQAQNPSSTTGTWRQCPDPRHPSSTSPTPHCQAQNPSSNACRHLTGMPWPPTPLLHKPHSHCQAQNPSSTAGTWRQCPDPRHPSSTSPTPHCQAQNPSSNAGTWQECPDPRHPSSTSPTPHCQAQNPSSNAGTWQECPDPRHPSSTSPTPHCQAQNPSSNAGTWQECPDPWHPSSTGPGTLPAISFSSTFTAIPYTAEPWWPATWYIKWSPWECHYLLGWCWQWWFLFDPTPSTTSLSCAPNADTAAGPQQPRPEGAAYPIPLPSARDALRDSPTSLQISLH